MVLLEDVRREISEANYQEVSDFIEHREFGIALDWICAAIRKEGKELSAEQRELVKTLSEDMKLDPKDLLGDSD